MKFKKNGENILNYRSEELQEYCDLYLKNLSISYNLKQKDKLISILLDELKNKNVSLYNKEIIKNIVGCEDDKALRILKFMFQNKLGLKIGKEYYTTKEDWEKFLKLYKGKVLSI